MKRIFIFLFLLAVLNPLFADVDTNNQAQNILLIFKNAAANWESVIIPASMYVFWSLVAIDFVLSFGYMAIKGIDFGELFYELIRKVMTIGFFLFLFFTIDLMDYIPKSFSQLANNAVGVDIEPDNILELGVDIVANIWKGISMWSPADSFSLVFSGIIILIAFTLMAAELLIVIVKLYILIAGAYMVYSLGGLSYTRSYAINPIIAIIKAGLELFFIKLILGLSITTIEDMSVNVGTDNYSIIGMIVVSILLATLTKMTSGLVDSLMNGHLGNNSGGMGMAKAAGSAMVGGAVGAAAGSIAGTSAVNAAKNLSASGQGSTLGNIAKAAGADAINTITGANKYAAGNMGVRMANSMNQKSDILNTTTSSSISTPKNDFKDAIKSAKSESSSNENSNSSNSEYVSGINENLMKD